MSKKLNVNDGIKECEDEEKFPTLEELCNLEDRKLKYLGGRYNLSFDDYYFSSLMKSKILEYGRSQGFYPKFNEDGLEDLKTFLSSMSKYALEHYASSQDVRISKASSTSKKKMIEQLLKYAEILIFDRKLNMLSKEEIIQYMEDHKFKIRNLKFLEKASLIDEILENYFINLVKDDDLNVYIKESKFKKLKQDLIEYAIENVYTIIRSSRKEIIFNQVSKELEIQFD